MGCASSIDHAPAARPLEPRLPVSAQNTRSAKMYDEVSALNSSAGQQWEAGYVLDESAAGPVTRLEDYRGFDVSISANASRNKIDLICRWADNALAERDATGGGAFFDPQNPAVWPPELLAAHEAYTADQFMHPGAAGAATRRKPRGPRTQAPPPPSSHDGGEAAAAAGGQREREAVSGQPHYGGGAGQQRRRQYAGAADVVRENLAAI